MIHLNLIDAAERLVEVENVAPVNVTSVKELQKKSRKKAMTVLVAALFVFVAFSCFLSVAGVPQPLQGLLPPPYLELIGAEDPTRSALAIGAGQRTSAGGSLEAEAAAAAAMIRQRENVTVKQVVGEINGRTVYFVTYSSETGSVWLSDDASFTIKWNGNKVYSVFNFEPTNPQLYNCDSALLVLVYTNDDGNLTATVMDDGAWYTAGSPLIANIKSLSKMRN